jgi:hypothetical protein
MPKAPNKSVEAAAQVSSPEVARLTALVEEAKGYLQTAISDLANLSGRLMEIPDAEDEMVEADGVSDLLNELLQKLDPPAPTKKASNAKKSPPKKRRQSKV